MKPRSKDVVWQCWRRAMKQLQDRVWKFHYCGEAEGYGRIFFPPSMRPELRAWHMEWRDYLFEERERGLAAYDHFTCRSRAASNAKRKLPSR